jgi:serine/threonine-protein kinase
MAIDERRITEFINESTLRQTVAAVLRKAGFIIVWVQEEAKGSRWGFYLKLPRRLRDTFGTGREVLVWVVQSSEFQARTVTQAADIISREKPRLCEDFAIIITHDPDTATHTSETGSALDVFFLGFNVADFRSFEPFGKQDFVRALQRRLYARDLYDLPTAVTRSDDFYGRRSLVTDLATRLRQGSRHIGLFGLRKIGKTSVIYRLRSVLRNGDAAFVAHVDIERIDAIHPSADYLLWSIGEAIFDAHRQIRRVPGLNMIGQYRLYSAIPNPDTVFELFDHDVHLILNSVRRPLVLMFDEIELLSPDTPGSEWGNSFVRIWRLLRGLDQQMPGRFSFLVTGTNPSSFETNRIGSQENPAYNYFSIEYLKPLDLEETGNLLRGIGERIGLQWQEDAVKFTFSATGGHPALVRTFASGVFRHNPPLDSPVAVGGKQARQLVERYLVEKSSLLSQVVAVLNEQYPSEYYLLETLARGELSTFREYAAAFPDDVAHLIGYGLCDLPDQCVGLNIELLQTFLQRRHTAMGSRKVEGIALGTDSHVAEYTILKSVGRPGGFARVYSARAPGGGTVAVKVFERGLLSALQRELQALQEIEHPSIVKILDYGQSDDGLVYMVMEYIAGPTMRQYCSKSLRAEEREVADWLNSLLSALIVIHPDSERIAELRGREEISTEELTALEEARHGFIHRDIKPENIILSDHGPVLIDFNISVKASSPVRTVSVTPGYLPPDWQGNMWTPDIDVYQLGVTMLQVALGVEFTGENLEDLRSLARDTLKPGLSEVLIKMTSPISSERFPSADSAKRRASRLAR